MGITQDLLKEAFNYRDGELRRKVSPNRNIKIGDLAGHVRSDGYRAIMVHSELYLAHRLIFLYHHGYLPEFLDHIDGNPLNNDISNLREVTLQENQMNRKKNKSMNGKPTSSKFKGVSWDKLNKKWQAYIYIDGKQKNLGFFIFEIEAAITYNHAAIETFAEFARINEGIE